MQSTVANDLGIPKENVTCHVTLLGGGFGRKSKPDYVAEAAILSKKARTPRQGGLDARRRHQVRLLPFGRGHVHEGRARRQDGKPTAWLQRSVFPPIGSTFALNATYGDRRRAGLGFTDMPFDIPNLRVENGPAKAHVRIGWLRSVANIYHAFAVQSFADELAHAANQDSLEYLSRSSDRIEFSPKNAWLPITAPTTANTHSTRLVCAT